MSDISSDQVMFNTLIAIADQNRLLSKRLQEQLQILGERSKVENISLLELANITRVMYAISDTLITLHSGEIGSLTGPPA